VRRVEPTYDSYLAAPKGRVSADPRDTGFDEAAFRRNTPEAWFLALKGAGGVRCRRITYGSDGLRVTGFIVEPSTPGRHRAVIFNRGGTQAFGAIRTADLVEFAGWALDGYVVVASQYRGIDGGEGREEWGGADVHDVLNLAALARSLPSVDSEALYMYDVSRGGMMTYRALAAGLRVRAAATVGAPADLEAGLTHRPEMEEVYRDLMPGYATRKAEHLRARSAVHWAESIQTPLLVLHDGADWRVWPGESLVLATRLSRVTDDRPRRFACTSCSPNHDARPVRGARGAAAPRHDVPGDARSLARLRPGDQPRPVGAQVRP